MTTPCVYLVGAGPGHPGLLTVRALEILQRAEFLLYDKLIPPRILDLAPLTATRVCVADLAECHKDRHQPTVDAMVDAARRGQRVVRLKGGDPFIFGRGGEEAEELVRAGIRFEIVPGVTAALGAAAFAGIPLTHRAFASGVAFVTGHEIPEKPENAVDWPRLADFPGTLVIYMGIARLGSIVQALVENGKPGDTPAAVIASATTGRQRTITGRLAEMPVIVQQAGITAPALIIIGEVTALHRELGWFERLPLAGKRVLVTRPRHQSAEMVQQLEAIGAMPIVLPAVEIREPPCWDLVDQAITCLGSYDWLVFTSANGVHAFVQRLFALGRDLRALGAVQLAAIGPKTAETLRHYHLQADLVPTRYQSEDLAAALAQKIIPGQHVLLARADRGREILREVLGRITHVDQIAVYSQVDALETTNSAFATIRRGEVDYITLTSSNIARAVLQSLDDASRGHVLSGRTKLVSISPVTSAEIARHGLPVSAEASEATMTGVIDALVQFNSNIPGDVPWTP